MATKGRGVESAAPGWTQTTGRVRWPNPPSPKEIDEDEYVRRLQILRETMIGA